MLISHAAVRQFVMRPMHQRKRRVAIVGANMAGQALVITSYSIHYTKLYERSIILRL